MQNIPNIEQGPISVDALYEIVGSAMSVPSVAMGSRISLSFLMKLKP